MEEASDNYEQTDTEILVALAPAEINENVQVVMPKNIVLDPRWFDGDRMKFEDWWRGIRLFLKSNRIIETNNRITAILARLRRGVAGIYTQKKLDELNKEIGTQNWDNFLKDIKTTFSNKMKTADAKWKIESFKQEK